MPKKEINTKLIEEYLDHIKKEKNLSTQTLKTYNDISKQLPFNILTSQPVIIKKVKELYTNPNTISLYLNLIILVRKYNKNETDKLQKYKNGLRDQITNTRKMNLDILDDVLPSIDVIMEKLDTLNKEKYIINYLMINHGFRNKDINLEYKTKLPKEGDFNYMTIKNKKVLLQINDYKTDKANGQKNITIDDTRFVNELKSMKLSEGDFLLPKKNGEKIKSISTFNEKILRQTINQLGQNKLIKIKIKHLLDKKNYGALEKISEDRGTSMAVLLKSYNLDNGLENDSE